MKLTVKAYAKKEGISVQTVYAHFKRGTLKSLKENGILYVVNDVQEDNSFKDFKEKGLKSENNLKEAFKIIKRKDKEIKRLTIKLEECNSKKEEVYLSYIAEQKHQKIQELEYNKNLVPSVKTFWKNLWRTKP